MIFYNHRSAGTATPAFLLTAPAAFGLACLITLWALTITAAAIHLAWMSAPELLVGTTFVGLGCAAGLALPWVWIHAGIAPAALMLMPAGCFTWPERSPTIAAGPTRTPQCSATTKSFISTSAPPRPASTSQ